MSTTFKQLEALHWVAKLGSFESAAARLHTTQSAVSKRIRELEIVFGGQLFDRTRRKAELTPKGRRVAAAAEEILELNRRMIGDLVVPERRTTTVRVGVTEMIAMTWLERFIRNARQRFDSVQFEMVVDHGGNLLGRLSKGSIDLALTPGPMWGNSFESISLAPLRRAWMASPTLGVPMTELTFEELSQYPVVIQDVDTIHAQLQNAWFQRHGFYAQEKIITNSTMVLGNLVMSGLGIGLLPVGYYAEAIGEGRLVQLRTSPELPNVDYFAVFRREYESDLIHELGRLACGACQEEIGWSPDLQN